KHLPDQCRDINLFESFSSFIEQPCQPIELLPKMVELASDHISGRRQFRRVATLNALGDIEQRGFCLTEQTADIFRISAYGSSANQVVELLFKPRKLLDKQSVSPRHANPRYKIAEAFCFGNEIIRMMIANRLNGVVKLLILGETCDDYDCGFRLQSS